MKKSIFIFIAFFLTLAGFAEVRVVSLSPAVTETIFQLGAEKLLVGRSSACDYPRAAENIPIAGEFGIPDLEKILQLRADLVITNVMVNPAAAKTLQRHGVRVLVAPCDKISDYRALVAELGKLLACEDAAAREIERIDAAKARWARARNYPYRVLMIIWEKPIVVPGNGTFCQELLLQSGVKALDFKGKKGYFTPDAEYLLLSDPDIVLVLRDPEGLSMHPVLKKMRAVREKKVIKPVDPDIFQRPGPRWIEAVDFLRGEWGKMDEKN